MVMLKALVNWFRSWFGVATLNRQLAALERQGVKLEKERLKSERELTAGLNRVERLQTDLSKEVKSVREAALRAEGLNKRLASQIEAVQEALRVANDIVIPSLIQANDTFRQTWDAQSSLAVMRAAAGRLTDPKEAV